MTKWEGHVLNAACAAARLGTRVVIVYNDAGFAVRIESRDDEIPIEEAVVRCLLAYERRHKPCFHYTAQALRRLGEETDQ